MSGDHGASLHDRALAYLAKLEPAITGSGGHDATYRAAMILVQDFALSPAEALPLLQQGFNFHCSPPWSESELRHKLESAAANIDQAKLGRLAGSEQGAKTYPDSVHQFAAIRGFSLEALRALGTAPKGREIHTPERDEKGERTAINRRRGDNTTFDSGDKSLVVPGGKRGVFVPWPFLDAGTVAVCEGLPDTARALTARHGAVVGTPVAKPGRVVLRKLQKLLKGRDVVLFPHPDAAGRAWLGQVGTCLSNVGCAVRFVPALDQDLDDRLKGEGDQAGALAGLIAEAMPWEPAPVNDPARARGGYGGGAAGRAKPAFGGGDDGRREIIVDTDEAKVGDIVMETLRENEDELFQRSGSLVTVAGAQSTKEVRRFGGLSITPVNAAWVRDRTTRHARFVAWDGERMKRVHPPDWLGKALISRTCWPVPELTGVANYPVLTVSGLMTTPGYDEHSGWLILPNARPEGFKTKPTRDDLAAARALLHEAVCDFPFSKGEAGEAAWVALVLTILARPAIDGPVPLFLAEASTRGSGKTKLISIAGMIATGVLPAVIPEAADGEEDRKRITSILLVADPIVLLDNVIKLGGTALDALLTSLLWKDRILSRSEVKSLPNLAVWCASGNNVAIQADTRRRILPFRLEPDTERPETRANFVHANLEEWVMQHRPALLGAALTLLAGWHEAGRPSMGLEPWGSYEMWTRIVRNCLVWSGYPDPAVCRDELTIVADPEVAHLGAVLELLAWHKGRSSSYLTAKEIIAKVQDGEYEGDAADTVRELATGHAGQINAKSLGHKLERWRGRVVGGWRLNIHPGRGGIATYSAEQVSTRGSNYENESNVSDNASGDGCFDCCGGSVSEVGDQDNISNAGGFGCCGGSVSGDYARTGNAGAYARTREPRKDSHHNTQNNHETAGELRARLLARGIVLALDEDGRLIVRGSMTAEEDAALRPLQDAMKRLILKEQDGLPF